MPGGDQTLTALDGGHGAVGLGVAHGDDLKGELFGPRPLGFKCFFQRFHAGASAGTEDIEHGRTVTRAKGTKSSQFSVRFRAMILDASGQPIEAARPALLLDDSGNPIRLPLLLNEAEGNVIRMAFGMDAEGRLPRVMRNLFKAGKVPPGSEKEQILHGMARKGLIELIGVVGSKLSDRQKVELRGALESASETVALKPERLEAVVTRFGLDSFKHTLNQSKAAREIPMEKNDD